MRRDGIEDSKGSKGSGDIFLFAFFASLCSCFLRYLCFLLFKICPLFFGGGLVLAETGEVGGGGALGFGEGEDTLLGGVPLTGFAGLQNRVEGLKLSIGHLAFGALLGHLPGNAVEPLS